MPKLTPTLLLLTLVTMKQPLNAQSYQLASPHGSNRINIYLDGNISYTVMRNGQLILDQSPISLTVNGEQLGVNPRVRRTQTTTAMASTVYKPWYFQLTRGHCLPTP